MIKVFALLIIKIRYEIGGSGANQEACPSQKHGFNFKQIAQTDSAIKLPAEPAFYGPVYGVPPAFLRGDTDSDGNYHRGGCPLRV